MSINVAHFSSLFPFGFEKTCLCFKTSTINYVILYVAMNMNAFFERQQMWLMNGMKCLGFSPSPCIHCQSLLIASNCFYVFLIFALVRCWWLIPAPTRTCDKCSTKSNRYNNHDVLRYTMVCLCVGTLSCRLLLYTALL